MAPIEWVFLELWRERDGWAGADEETLARIALVADAIALRLAEQMHDVGRGTLDPLRVVPEIAGAGIDDWYRAANAAGWSFPHPAALAGGPLLRPAFRLSDGDLDRAWQVAACRAVLLVFGEHQAPAGWLRMLAARAASVDPPAPGEAERLRQRLAALPPVPDPERVAAHPLAQPLAAAVEQAGAGLDPALYELVLLRLVRDLAAVLGSADDGGDRPDAGRRAR